MKLLIDTLQPAACHSPQYGLKPLLLLLLLATKDNTLSHLLDAFSNKVNTPQRQHWRQQQQRRCCCLPLSLSLSHTDRQCPLFKLTACQWPRRRHTDRLRDRQTRQLDNKQAGHATLDVSVQVCVCVCVFLFPHTANVAKYLPRHFPFANLLNKLTLPSTLWE